MAARIDDLMVLGQNISKTDLAKYLRDRETVRLSGLIQESTSKTSRKVPLLGDIPLLGAFFRWNYEKTTNRELVIFVTPRILD